MTRVGEWRVVFDAKLWGGKDVGDNSQFWKTATITELDHTEHGEEIATVMFHYDGRTSKGHFTSAMREID